MSGLAEQDGFGAAVRACREAAGMTVEQVSARTRIRPAVLRDLESGSTVRSGGDAYARGHLRAIAQATGSDPAPLLAAHDRSVDVRHDGGLDAALAAGPGAVRPRTGARRDDPSGAAVPGVAASPSRPVAARLALPRPEPERGRPPWGLAGVAAGLVLVALVGVGALTRSGATPAVVTGVVEGVAPPAAAPPPTPPVPSPVTGAALRLHVGRSPSWVSVLTASGSPLFRGVLGAGSARAFSDPAGLSLTVGNAGSVTLDCGGRTVPAGGPGQVRRYTCAADGLVAA